MKTHCLRGHEYTEENTRLVGPEKQHRTCKECEVVRRRLRGMQARDPDKCRNGHPYDEANTRKSGDSEWRVCRACQREWHQNNPEGSKLARLWTRYRLTREEFVNLHGAQSGQCAVCETVGLTVEAYLDTTDRSETFWHIDHDHACCSGSTSCGACVRGLLCDPCNRAIALLKDDSENAKRAAVYLERTKLDADAIDSIPRQHYSRRRS